MAWGCGGGESKTAAPEVTASAGKALVHSANTGDPNVAPIPIPLKDASGNAIVRGSTTPYSPEQTCGGCHDVDMVTRGYHFQQGRTGPDNQLLVSDSYNPAKRWLLSDGMYGKT